MTPSAPGLTTSHHATATAEPEDAYPAVPLVPGLVVDVCITIADLLDARSLLCVRTTSRVGDAYATFILRRRIRFLVGRAMANFPAFMRQFEDLRCVVSGEAALHILFPWHTPPTHIDIYVPRGSLTMLKNHLVRRQHFREQSPPPPAPHPIRSGVRHPNSPDPLLPQQIVRTIRMQHEETSFRLHECPDATTLDVLLSQWNTALMNYVGAKTFCVAYPDLTREQRALITPSRDIPFDRECADWVWAEHARWADEGWSVAGIPATWEPSVDCPGGRRLGCAATMRYWGDRGCARGVIAPVGSSNLRGPLGDVARTETAVWWRGGRTCGGMCTPTDGEVPVRPRVRQTAWSLVYST